MPVEQVLELGLGTDGDRGQFDMTAFSLRLTNGANAVSQLHAETANATWQGTTEHSILGITNGVHGPTWVGQPVVELLARHLDADLDQLDAGRRPGPLLGAHGARSRPTTCGRRTCARSASSRSSRAAACAASSPATARRRRSWPSSRPRSTRASSRSASRGGSRPTSGPACCSATSTGCGACSGTQTGRSRSSSPARPTRPTGPASG